MRGLIQLLVMSLIAFGCVKPVNKGVYYTYQDQIEFGSAVRIAAICQNGGLVSGSGVAVSDHKVITAKHLIINCHPDVFYIFMRENNKVKQIEATLGDLVSGVDVMSLITEEKLLHVAPIKFDSPLVGEEVCSIGGGGLDNGWIKKCGYVAYFDENGWIASIPAVPGNSGSPVYDYAGRIVGILVQGSWGEGREKYANSVPVKAWKELL